MRTSLEESGWCQRERWFNLPVLCSGMVGFQDTEEVKKMDQEQDEGSVSLIVLQ